MLQKKLQLITFFFIPIVSTSLIELSELQPRREIREKFCPVAGVYLELRAWGQANTWWVILRCMLFCQLRIPSKLTFFKNYFRNATSVKHPDPEPKLFAKVISIRQKLSCRERAPMIWAAQDLRAVVSFLWFGSFLEIQLSLAIPELNKMTNFHDSISSVNWEPFDTSLNTLHAGY